jgi:2-methylcitrate dehydratase PrpD
MIGQGFQSGASLATLIRYQIKQPNGVHDFSEKRNKMTLSEKIAEFIFRTNYGDLPPEVVNKAKQCLMDALGVSVLGSKSLASKIVFDAVNHFQSRQDSVLIGTPCKAAAPLAAMVNGVSAHVADFDDTSVAYQGHPSCVIVPAVVAAAEAVHAGGQEVILSIVAGNEVGSKLGLSMGKKHYQKGWHGTATIGTIAATAAVAKLYKLEPKQIMDAIGFSASSASGIRQNFGSMTKSWHSGHPAYIGVLSAVLAQGGFDASAEALEGNEGFLRVFDGEGTIEHFDSLGKPYSITDIAFKKYPSCAATHPAVEAILILLDRKMIKPEMIARIDCHCCTIGRAAFRREYPHSELEGKFSIEYCIAATLVKGRLGVEEFEDETMNDPEVRSIMEKVQVFTDPKLDEVAASRKVLAPTRIELVIKDGQHFTETIIAARGGSLEPLSWTELDEKFKECVNWLIPQERIEKILSLIHKVEGLRNIEELTAHLRGMG